MLRVDSMRRTQRGLRLRDESRSGVCPSAVWSRSPSCSLSLSSGARQSCNLQVVPGFLPFPINWSPFLWHLCFWKYDFFDLFSPIPDVFCYAILYHQSLRGLPSLPPSPSLSSSPSISLYVSSNCLPPLFFIFLFIFSPVTYLFFIACLTYLPASSSFYFHFLLCRCHYL